MTTPTPKPLLNATGVATLLGVSASTVYEWVQMDYIPHVKLGGCVRFDEDDVWQWVKQRKSVGRLRRVPA